MAPSAQNERRTRKVCDVPWSAPQRALPGPPSMAETTHRSWEDFWRGERHTSGGDASAARGFSGRAPRISDQDMQAARWSEHPDRGDGRRRKKRGSVGCIHWDTPSVGALGSRWRGSFPRTVNHEGGGIGAERRRICGRGWGMVLVVALGLPMTEQSVDTGALSRGGPLQVCGREGLHRAGVAAPHGFPT